MKTAIFFEENLFDSRYEVKKLIYILLSLQLFLIK